ncbi:NAD(P)-dependent oxidoreductase [Ningiella sp. W23]|uniref:NAD(P)-dependent oxidoreductase n=1 Tax=Ningiella sp. W23 TaxID=3023715 RepID=UPI003758427E
MKNMQLSFIGLGAMGFPMAGHLYRAGYFVTVYNRTQEKAVDWCKSHPGGEHAKTPREACEGADAVFMCVGNDDDVRSVVYGDDGVLASMRGGAVLVDHTTTSAVLANELAAKCNSQQIPFLDAPVSGGQAGAENGRLTVMLGGDQISYKRIAPLLDCYAQKHALMGGVGSGQQTKMVNQICIAGLVQGLSEALHFAMQAGLDTQQVVDVISKGAAQSWQMDNRAHTMVNNEFDFGFAVDWMRKDLSIVLDEAKKNNSTLPVTALVDQLYAQVQKNGGGRFDTSSLISLLNDKK